MRKFLFFFPQIRITRHGNHCCQSLVASKLKNKSRAVHFLVLQVSDNDYRKSSFNTPSLDTSLRISSIIASFPRLAGHSALSKCFFASFTNTVLCYMNGRLLIPNLTAENGSNETTCSSLPTSTPLSKSRVKRPVKFRSKSSLKHSRSYISFGHRFGLAFLMQIFMATKQVAMLFTSFLSLLPTNVFFSPHFLNSSSLVSSNSLLSFSNELSFYFWCFTVPVIAVIVRYRPADLRSKLSLHIL